MLDKSLEFHQVLMVKRDTDVYPRFSLPEGYSFVLFRPGMEEDWCRIQCGVDHIESMDQARKVFREEYLLRPRELREKCVFVLDGDGRFAGTASLWPGDHFGRELHRIHWVAVSGRHQGLGLAKALMTRVFDIYSELGCKEEFLYLVSSTWSYKALGIYGRFGFVPYLGEKPVNLKDKYFDENNRRAWEIVQRKLASRD